MDNPQSKPQLKFAPIPDDFNSGVGVDFARALVKFLESAEVVGLNFENSEPFDAAKIQQSVEDLTDTLNGNIRGQRKVEMNGVANGELIVPFQTMQTTDYEVNPILVIPAGINPPTVTFALVDGSKQDNQFKVRVDGNGAPYKIFFVITQIREATAKGTGNTI